MQMEAGDTKPRGRARGALALGSGEGGGMNAVSQAGGDPATDLLMVQLSKFSA